MSILQIKLTSVASVRQHSTKGFEESEMDFSENSTGDGNVSSSGKYINQESGLPHRSLSGALMSPKNPRSLNNAFCRLLSCANEDNPSSVVESTTIHNSVPEDDHTNEETEATVSEASNAPQRDMSMKQQHIFQWLKECLDLQALNITQQHFKPTLVPLIVGMVVMGPPDDENQEFQFHLQAKETNAKSSDNLSVHTDCRTSINSNPGLGHDYSQMEASVGEKRHTSGEYVNSKSGHDQGNAALEDCPEDPSKMKAKEIAENEASGSRPGVNEFQCCEKDVSQLKTNTVNVPFQHPVKNASDDITREDVSKSPWTGNCEACDLVHGDAVFPCLKVKHICKVKGDYICFRDGLKSASNDCAFLLKDSEKFRLDDICFSTQIAKSGFGDVFECKSNGCSIVCKIVKQEIFYSDEAAVHLLSDGKFAAKLYAVVFKYGHVFLLMEKLCPLGTIPAEEMAYRTLSTVAKYKRLGLENCDIKYQHLCLRLGEKEILILDWGSVWFIFEDWVFKGWTLSYLSPDRKHKDQPPQRCDEYAVAICVLRHIFGRSPLTKMRVDKQRVDLHMISSNTMHRQVLACITEAAEENKISYEFADLLFALVAVNPNDRLSAEEAITRDIFKKFRQENDANKREPFCSIESSGYSSCKTGHERVDLTLYMGETLQHGTVIKYIHLWDAVAMLLEQHKLEMRDFAFYEFFQGNKVPISEERWQRMLENSTQIFCEKRQKALQMVSNTTTCCAEE